MSSIRRRVVSNTFVNTLSFGVRLIIGFIIIPLYLDRLGLDGFGMYSLLLIFSATGLLSFFDLGFEAALIKFVSSKLAANSADQANKYIVNGIIFYSVLGISIGLIFFLLSELLIRDIFNVPFDIVEYGVLAFKFYAVQLFFQFISIAYSASFKAKERFVLIAILNSGYVILNLLLVYFTLKSIVNLPSFIIYQNILFLLKLLVETYFCKRLYSFSKGDYAMSKKILLDIAGYAKYLFLSKVIGFIFNYLDKLLISLMLPISYMTNYNILVKIPDSIRNIQSLLNSTIVPVSSSLKSTNQTTGINELILYGTRYMVILILPVVIISMLLMNQFLILWVGNEFENLSISANILLLSFFFSVLFSFGSTVVVGTGDVKKFLPISLLGCAVNLGLSLILIRNYELKGLVLATSFSYFIIFVFYVFRLRKIFKIDNYSIAKMILKPYFMIVGLGMFLYVILPFVTNFEISIISFVIQGAVLVSLFTIVIYLFVLHEKEKCLILSNVKKVWK